MKGPYQRKTMINPIKEPIKSLKTIAKQTLKRQFSLSENAALYGCDVWTAFELSWLNNFGKPQVAIGEFIIQPTSIQLIDSKSLKIYINSFNMAQFASMEVVQHRMKEDLTLCIGEPIEVIFIAKSEFERRTIQQWKDTYLDTQMVDPTEHCMKPILHTIGENNIRQSYCSDLLRFICFHSGKPIFGSVRISLISKELEQRSLLEYIISYRNTVFPPEILVEQIFYDIQRATNSETLLIELRLNRQGGISSSFFRSNNINCNYQINTILARQ